MTRREKITRAAGSRILMVLELTLAKGSQKAAAKEIGISAQFFGDIVNGKRAVTEAVCAHFGYRRLIVVQKASALPPEVPR